jgi:hypothetical protein
MNLISNAIKFWNLKSDWLGEGGKPVPIEQSQQRADVCTQGMNGKPCPHNQEKPIYEMFAGSVAHRVIKQLKLKDEMGLRVKREENLHVCSVCKCILKLKVHTPLKFILSSGNLEGLPEWCWQVTESKTQNSHDTKDNGLHE